jgi:hypothetical protein
MCQSGGAAGRSRGSPRGSPPAGVWTPARRRGTVVRLCFDFAQNNEEGGEAHDAEKVPVSVQPFRSSPCLGPGRRDGPRTGLRRGPGGRGSGLSAGPRRPGAGGPRRRERPPHLRVERRRRHVRAGLGARRGPFLPDGLLPPRLQRPAGGAAGRGGPGFRRGAAHPRAAPGRRGHHRHGAAAEPGLVPGLRERGERLAGEEPAAAGVRAARADRGLGAPLGACGQRGDRQGDRLPALLRSGRHRSDHCPRHLPGGGRPGRVRRPGAVLRGPVPQCPARQDGIHSRRPPRGVGRGAPGERRRSTAARPKGRSPTTRTWAWTCRRSSTRLT